MIAIRNLVKSYPGGTKALKGISLEIPQGSRFGLIGPNGAGKTTLISILNGLLKPDAGSVQVEGFDLKKQPARVGAVSSLVPQELALYPMMRVRENLEFFAAIQGVGGGVMRERIRFAIAATALEGLEERMAGKLSGGQQRRLNIAIGLVSKPRILYLDEPTVGIDPHSRRQILNTIKNLRQEKMTIVYTSHYMHEIEYLCDHIAIIDRGTILRQGSIEQILRLDKPNELRFSLEGNDPAKVEALLRQWSVPWHRDGDEYIAPVCSQTQYLDLIERLTQSRLTIGDMRYGKQTLEELFFDLTAQPAKDTR